MKQISTLLIFLLSFTVFAQDWVQVSPVTNPGIRPSISVVSDNCAWIADGQPGSPKIFRTIDAGVTWQVIPTTGITREIYCVWGMSEQQAFVGEGEVNGSARMFQTMNGGANWTAILTSEPNGGHFTGLAFTKANGNIFGLSLAERIYRSSNSGVNWVVLNPGVNGVSNAQNSLMIIDNNFYGFGLNNGAARVRLTTNNAVSWITQQISVVGNYTSAIAFHSNKVYGLAATSTSPPMVSRTIDGGITWNSVSIGTGLTGTCYLVWIPNTPVVYILGSNGGVKRSIDNGVSWQTTPIPQGVTNLTHFDFYQYTNIVYGYAVSSNGNVIRLVDTLQILTGLNNNEVPVSYSLEQNYPNPFNPSTLIKYTLPKESFVKLAVFDVLGREVDVMVNENQKAGSYEMSWSAVNFTSGIYFYTITAGDFKETRKMILLK